MKFICEIFSRMSVIFRDESNETSLTIIGYSDTTVTTPNHIQIIHSKISLATVLLRYHSCGCCFVIRLHLISLIIDQNYKKFS